VEHQGSKEKVGTFHLQRSEGISKKVSQSRRSQDCMQAWDSKILSIVRFQENLKIGFLVWLL